MGRRRKIAVDVDEVVLAVKRALVREFDGRPIDWETITQGLAIASLEIKQAALFAPPIKDKSRPLRNA